MARNASACHFLVCWGNIQENGNLEDHKGNVSLDLREVSWLVMVQDHVQWRGFSISGGERLGLAS